MVIVGYVVPALYGFVKTAINSPSILIVMSIFPQVASFPSLLLIFLTLLRLHSMKACSSFSVSPSPIQTFLTPPPAGFSSITTDQVTKGYPFRTVLIMQAVDFFFWGFLAWYLDQVMDLPWI